VTVFTGHRVCRLRTPPQALFPRSEQFAAESDQNHSRLFDDQVPAGLLALFAAAGQAE
jgi:hypothetical protein